MANNKKKFETLQNI